jgi:hypothetical protein
VVSVNITFVLDVTIYNFLQKKNLQNYTLKMEASDSSEMLVHMHNLRDFKLHNARPYNPLITDIIHKKNLHGLSPRANYTDRATAAFWRSDCQLLRIEGAAWSA